MTAQKIAPAGGRGMSYGTWTPAFSPQRSRAASETFILCADPLYEASVGLAMERQRVELDLAGQLVADPIHAMAAVQAAGVTPEMILAPDVKIIADAAWIGHRLPLEKIARLAKLALRYFGWWDESDPRTFARVPFWSDASLSSFCTSYLPSPTLARREAMRLIDIDRRQREAAACIRRAMELLEWRAAA